MKLRNLNFTESINEAMILSMKRQKNVICYGLGVDDPNRVFETTKKLEEDYMLEEELIKKFKEVVYPKKEFMTKVDFDKEMNEYFLDALRTGRSKLALSIQFDSGAEIDVNGYSEELKSSPLMALATALGVDGGDIEMFMRLILEGAEYDYNKLD